jgi:Undecaprenyl-phosphate galactose phosphotransferase WbaP
MKAGGKKVDTVEVYKKPAYLRSLPAERGDGVGARVTHLHLARPATSPWATRLTFLLADILAMSAVAAVLYVAALAIESVASFVIIAWVFPAAVLISISFFLSGLYQAVALHPAQELQRAATVITVVFAALGMMLFVAREINPAIVAWLGVTWVMTILFITLFRAFFRVLCARYDWWGTPVVVMAGGRLGHTVIDTLQRWPELGLKPVAVLDDSADGGSVAGVPVVGGIHMAPAIASQYRVPYAIVALPGISRRECNELLGRYSKFFRRLFVVPNVPEQQALWTTTSSFEGLLGFGVQHCSWNWTARSGKRIMDFAGAILALLLIAPVMAALAVMIRLDSKGPVFYTQWRLGQNGRCFRVLKFRSMFVDADRKLQKLFEEDPELREEYEVFHKLRNDPRITPVGRLIRRYSLDELPQLLNVLKGEMSLVGPRAYMPSELPKMDRMEPTILQNRPGITGLWQVSGRNGLSFEERVQLDVHYMHNWTPWLDLYILIRTFPVVMTGEGAC